MRLWVTKDSVQSGPHTLEEARALVLAGQLSALDWAWIDGATEWIPLKDVPEFSNFSPPSAAAPVAPPPQPAAAPASAFITNTAGPTAPGATSAPLPVVTSAPTLPPVATPAPAPSIAGTSLTEEILWRGHPSQVLLLRLYIFWAIVLGSISLATAASHHLWPILAVLVFLAVMQLIWRNFRRRAIQYVITTQRVRTVSGLLSKDIQEIELFRVKDTTVHQGIIPRLFGLGTIVVISGDAQSPRLVLRGVPHAVDLRERLRHEVIALRQRYNVRQFDMM